MYVVLHGFTVQRHAGVEASQKELVLQFCSHETFTPESDRQEASHSISRQDNAEESHVKEETGSLYSNSIEGGIL